MQRFYESSHVMDSRRKLPLLSNGSKSCPVLSIICIISLLFSIILIISKLEKAIWVSIQCRKTGQSDNQHFHHRGTVSIQTKSVNNSIRPHQSIFPHRGRCCCCTHPIWIGLTDSDVHQPSSTQFSFKIIIQSIKVTAMATLFSCQT